MAALAEVFGKQLSPQLTDIYWQALKGMPIEQFQEAGASWIRHGKHFPKPAELTERYREQQQAESKGVPEIPPPLPKWLGLVNGMFMKYLVKRRATEGFKGDIDVGARRAECLSMAQWMEGLEAEGHEVSEAQLKKMFDSAMARIPDKSDSPDWLPIELERQRAEDRERERTRP